MPHIYKIMAGINPPFTVADAMHYWGATDGALFNGDMKADRMVAELFYDNFLFCMEKNWEEFDEDLK